MTDALPARPIDDYQYFSRGASYSLGESLHIFSEGKRSPFIWALGFVAIGTLKALLVHLLGNHGEPPSTAQDLVPGYQFNFDFFLAGHRKNIDFQQE